MGMTNLSLLTGSFSCFLKCFCFNELFVCCPWTTRVGVCTSVVVNTICLHVGAGFVKQSQHLIRLERAFSDSPNRLGELQLPVTIGRAGELELCVQNHITVIAALAPSFEVRPMGFSIARNTALLGHVMPVDFSPVAALLSVSSQPHHHPAQGIRSVLWNVPRRI